MAIKINSGDLNQHIILKQPTHEQNDEGGREAVSLTNTITTWAAVRVVNESRLSGVDGTALLNAKDFYFRWRTGAEDITYDWLIQYRNEDYIIHTIERIEEKERWLRITGKVKSNG